MLDGYAVLRHRGLDDAADLDAVVHPLRRNQALLVAVHAQGAQLSYPLLCRC
jgi:hypothetical protein